MSTYVWCEDRASGLMFWKEMFQLIYPDAIVETKENNSRLCRAASKIEQDGNHYYILLDIALDNQDIIREYDRLKYILRNKELRNVNIVEIHSFEFVLLSFKYLSQWVFTEGDELKEKRADLLKARELFLSMNQFGTSTEALAEIKKVFPYATSHNSEQTCAELLYHITKNTGFETNKKKLGDCFVNDCCTWKCRQDDDMCGLDEKRLTAEEKKRQLIEYSILKSALKKVEL